MVTELIKKETRADRVMIVGKVDGIRYRGISKNLEITDDAAKVILEAKVPVPEDVI